MERQSKGLRDLEAYCSGGQGPPWAVAPTDDDDISDHCMVFCPRMTSKQVTYST